MKCFDAQYNLLPKAELHCHLEGAIRTATLIDIAREHGLELPAYDVAGLHPRVTVFDQLKDLGSVLEAFGIAQKSFASPAVVERIANELFEDAGQQNIKLLEVLLSGILEQLIGDALHHCRGGEALLRNAEGFQHRSQVLELVKHCNTRVE